MWDVKIWMFREVWALTLVVLFAYPLHQLSETLWDRLLSRWGRTVAPRAARGEFWLTFFLVQVVFILFYLTLLLTCIL